MADLFGSGIQVTLEDTGASTSDRITSKSLQVAGLKPGQAYEYSSNSGQSWNSILAPLKSSAALRFDGQNDFVSIPNNSALPSGNSSYTLEAWIKPDAMGDRGIVGWGPWGTNSSVNALRLMGDGSIRHYWWGNDLDVKVGNLADGNWHHVAATFDGINRKVYVDGVLKGSDVPKRHLLPVGATNIRIGSTNNGEYFQGSIDDVGIWSKALSQDEITQRQVVPANTSDKELVLFYGFSEGSGSTAAALGTSSFGLGGTLVNGPSWTTRETSASQSQGTTSLQLQLPDGSYADGQLLVREQGAKDAGIKVVSSVKKWWGMYEIIVFNTSLDNPQGIIYSSIQEETYPGNWVTRHSLTKEQIAIGEKALPANSIDWQKNVRIISTYIDQAGVSHTSTQLWTAGLVIANGNNYVIPSATQSTSTGTTAVSAGGAFVIDTVAPSVKLNQPGGIDSIVSSKLGDNTISGTADPGQPLKLMSRVGSATSGNLRITSDNGADIYLNGKFIANVNNWPAPYDFSGLNIQAGANVLAILAYDEGGIAGLTGRFTVPSGTFGTSDLGGWKVLNVDPEPLTDNSAASRDKSIWKLPANWATTNFDDSSWSLPVDVRAKTGQYPWGNISGDPTWIWSADPYNHDAVLFRYSFTGTSSDVGLQTIADKIEVSSDGSFSYSLTPDQIRLLGQGQGKSLVALQQDLAGNAGRSSELSFAVDTEIGTVKIISVGRSGGKVSSEEVEVGQGPLKFQLDQYTGYWSSKLSDLQAYVKNYNPLISKNRVSITTDIIDFTDDQGGFAGELPYDRRWPAAEAINYWGTGGINNQFFAKISADFYVQDSSKYRFRTYNDDGVFLLIDNKLVINDPTLHPERVFTGDIDLQPGNHSIELFFFENGGEASLEFSASRFDPAKNSWGTYQLVGKDPLIKAKSDRQPDNFVLGETDPNLVVNLRIGDNNLGSALAGSDGKFTYQLSNRDLELIAKAGNSTSLIASISDNAGNAATSAPATVAVADSIPQVTITAIGGSDSQVTTKIGDSSIEGNGVANLSTSIFYGDLKLGVVTAGADGHFKYDLSNENLLKLGQGPSRQIYVEQATTSGKKGKSPIATFAIDTEAPIVTVDAISQGSRKVSRSRRVVEGRGEANGTVTLRLGDTLLGTSSTDAQGRFAHVMDDAALVKIANNTTQAQLRVEQVDSSGNRGVSAASSILAKLAPPILTNFALGGKDSVVSSQVGDALLTGLGEAGLAVTFMYKGQVLEANATADQTGKFSATLTAADIEIIGQGLSRTLTLQQLDDYGNLGEASTANFAVDTLAPILTLPAPGEAAALGGKDGVVSTQAGDATIVGKGEQGKVFVLSGTKKLAEIQVAADGLFRYSLTETDITTIGQGSDKILRFEQLDAAGNLGFTQVSFAVDTTPPPAPVITVVAGDSVVSGRSTDNLIQGTSEPGTNVDLYVKGVLITTVKSYSDGLFQYRLSPKDLTTIGEGDATLIAEISDAAGNRSRSTAFQFKIDTVAPAQPQLQSVGGDDLIVSTRGSVQVNQTVDNLVIGKAESNSTVLVSLGNKVLGQTLANGDGSFSYALSAPNVAAIGQGTGKSIQVVSVDTAGNTSVASKTFTFAIDTVAPTAPKLSMIGGTDGVISALAGDNLISGTAEPLSQLELRAISGSAADTESPLLSILLTADSSGRWNHSFSGSQLSLLENSALPLLSAIAVDAAGNQSASLSLGLKVDITAPSLTLAKVGGDDGIISSVSGDAVIRGTADANRWLSIAFQGRKLTDVRAGQDGAFNYTLSPENIRLIGEGLNKQLQISQVDAAGNSSTLTSQAFNVDVTAPNKAVIRSLGGTDKIVSSALADRVIRGIGEAGASIDLLSVAGTTRTLLGRQLVGSDGNFAYTLTPENLTVIGKGVGKSIVASTVDLAGNQSVSEPFGFQVQAMWKSGTSTSDKLPFLSGVDAITGLAGADTFVITSLGTVLMDPASVPAFDHILDFQIGVDRIDAPSAVAVGQVRDLGKIQSLVSSAIGNLLTTTAFPANSAAIFRYSDFDFGERTFLAINDTVSGFKPQFDGIIEITGYTGNLTALGLI